MKFKKSLAKSAEKTKVYLYYSNGTFDYRDKKRLKPFTRLRKCKEDVYKYEDGSMKSRLANWIYDINNGYFTIGEPYK